MTITPEQTRAVYQCRQLPQGCSDKSGAESPELLPPGPARASDLASGKAVRPLGGLEFFVTPDLA